MEYSNLLGKYKDATNQHNIMVIVGNGFDINMLNKYGHEFPNGQKITTTYSLFYSYYKRNCLDNDNVLIKAMEKARTKHKDNWADIEKQIPQAIKDKFKEADNDALMEKANDVKKKEILNDISIDLHKLQTAFSNYLSKYVDVKIENEIGKDSEKNYWAIGSLVSFLNDLSKKNYDKLLFPRYSKNNDIYNFLFINMNFTNLLDNYIYLDQNQFDPNMSDTTDEDHIPLSNINSYFNDRYNMDEDQIYSHHLHTNVIHPHGNQHIARSLLFGATDGSLLSYKESSKFNKGYWAQYSKYYKDLFENTRLFIIYGSSIGNTDKWWWENILSALAKDYDINIDGKTEKIHSELLIYWYNPNKVYRDSFLDRFNQYYFSKEDFIDDYAFKVDPQTGNTIKYDATFKKISK